MGPRTQWPRAIPPRVVATGFTTALLGDERTLREFVVGDRLVREMQERGENGVLYLFNDSLDPLNSRQLRVGVGKDPNLMRRFESFCGRPICDIPDPYECHGSYSDHFKFALRDRLDRLGIHPVIVDVHQAYGLGQYAPYVATTFQHYRAIQEHIAAECDAYTLRNLYRAQCPRCSCIDATEITDAGPDSAAFLCSRCGVETRQEVASLRGKLSWKLDCAARWNLYRIDTEVFSKAHLADKGTVSVASLVSRRFFGNRIPEGVKYGDLRLHPRLSGRLLEILPPAMLKQLLTERLTSDLDLTPDSIDHFASHFEVRPGLTYAAYVRRVLPRTALRAIAARGAEANAARPSLEVSDETLVTYGNRFSEFFHQKRHELRWPEASTLRAARPETVAVASEVVDYALALRSEGTSEADRSNRLKAHLASIPAAPEVYPFLRRVFRQPHGASITTLLAILPGEYLAAIQLILSCLTGRIQAEGDADDELQDEQRRAA